MCVCARLCVASLSKKPWYSSLGISSADSTRLVPPLPTRWTRGGGAVLGRRRRVKTLEWGRAREGHISHIVLQLVSHALLVT